MMEQIRELVNGHRSALSMLDGAVVVTHVVVEVHWETYWAVRMAIFPAMIDSLQETIWVAVNKQ